MSQSEYLTTAELAALLRIKERKVYDLAASGAVPCTKAMGKLLFPRKAVDAWLNDHASGLDVGVARERRQVFAGSHDPLLDWALRESRCGLATLFDGSHDGLDRFGSGDAIAAGLHLSADDGAWNVPAVAERFGDQRVVLVSFAWRDRGLIVPPSSTIGSIADLRGRRVVPRQAEAGSQTLFERLLADAGIDMSEMAVLPAARNEADAALGVLEGKADATFGLAALAHQYRLGFVPLLRERFDILCDRRSFFEPPLQRLWTFCRGPAFAGKAVEQGGYDVSCFGQVQFNGA